MRVANLVAAFATALLYSAHATPAPDHGHHEHHSHHHSRNLVQNPSFEDDAGRPWKTVGHVVSIREDRHIARTGHRAALFEIKNENQRPILYQTINHIKPGQNYRFTIYYSIPKGHPTVADGCQYEATLYGGTVRFLTEFGPGFDDGKYRKQEAVITGRDSETLLTILVYCENDPAEKIQVAFDDISLKKTDDPALGQT